MSSTKQLCVFCHSDDGREVRGSPDYFSMLPGQSLEMVWTCFSCAKIYHTVLLDYVETIDVSQPAKQLSSQVSSARQQVKETVIKSIKNENGA